MFKSNRNRVSSEVHFAYARIPGKIYNNDKKLVSVILLMLTMKSFMHFGGVKLFELDGLISKFSLSSIRLINYNLHQ